MVIMTIMWQDWRVPKQRYGIDCASLFVRRYQLALQALATVEIEELLDINPSSPRLELEVLKYVHLLTWLQCDRRSIVVYVIELLVHLEFDFNAVLVVQEKHDLALTVNKCAIVFVWAQEHKLSQVWKYFDEALFEYVRLSHLDIRLLKKCLLIYC